MQANTKAILLLTAPLIAGRGERAPILDQREYAKLVRFLRERHLQPADLLGPQAEELIKEFHHLIDRERLKRLLARGFLLSQAIERWQSRAIWVRSRAEAEYPTLLKTRLKEDAPPILYGCGDTRILDTGGLAVVGSRDVDAEVIGYTEGVGRLVANSGTTLISGGARGVDQAAMSGALVSGGKVVGVLSERLEQAALDRKHRTYLMNEQLVLISPYDPAAGFNVGHAMERNKLIYALSNAALVVNSDYMKGGTWAGAIEQLEKFGFVTLYVRSNGQATKGLEALRRKGAVPWPDPTTPEELVQTLSKDRRSETHTDIQAQFPIETSEEIAQNIEASSNAATTEPGPERMPEESSTAPAEELFAKVRHLLMNMPTPKTSAEVADELQVSRSQAMTWLNRLVDEGVLETTRRPVRYRQATTGEQADLFQ